MTKNDPTIQDKLTQLDELVAWFRGDEFVLEQAKTKLEAVKKLATAIEDDLSSVENEITIVKQSFASDAD